ncbi:MAG: hypothetical protein JWN21_896 [Sphingomonas bacterium]|uniref:BLUF domain-containing protein n=1 Tax=Sphingomonas bacterium TaxID=1895847 RepID=UPI0026298BCF|nr:BLUF domain-containing protein [Sphingomonas bacterium]MDB5695353.1 hypothetical protein [Sphingomonas bacterium]
MDRSLLYVSRQSPFTVDPERTIEEIVAAARLFNASMGITGALVSTQAHFAQLLEGPIAVVDSLMERIECDNRHTDVTVLHIEAVARRRLTNWSMAYSGNSGYVARQIEPLIGETVGVNSIRVQRLISLLVGLAGP